MLAIPADLWDEMIRHARQEHPLECCGILAGPAGSISHLFRLRNERASPVAYNADPRDLIAAHRSMRALKLEIVALYHSHPTSEARPSRWDLAENYYGQIPRIIVSLMLPQPIVKAFVLWEDRFEQIACEPQSIRAE